MARKTIHVDAVLAEANRMLALDTLSGDEKSGICHLVEHVLHASGRYRGFNYNYWLSQGCREWEQAGKPEDERKNAFIYGPSGCQFSRTYYGGA